VTIEYLRSGRAVTTYARAEVRKVGKRVANVHVVAWQDERAAPVAALGGHFTLKPD
jgi:acyl-coenzyme A thioesterase PaaI-like protein